MKKEESPVRRRSFSSFFLLPSSFPVYWLYRHSSGLWRWAGRRFTTAGLCVAGGWLATGVAGVDIENNETYQAFALLSALLIFSFSTCFLFRGKFSGQRSLPRFGTAGQPLYYEADIKNPGARPQTGLVLLEDLDDPRPSFSEWLAFKLAESRRIRPFRIFNRRQRSPFRVAKAGVAPIPPIPARGETTVRMELLPYRRGILRFSGLTIACADPLGLFRSCRRVSAPQTVLILPRRHPLPPIELPGQFRYQEGGVALASSIGCSEEFVSLRDYRHGDPLRHIHWRSWAKTGKPIVKEFEDEFFVRHALVLDTFTDEPHSEALEEAVSVAASFACTVLTQESLLDLLFIGNQSYCFTAGRGLGTADQMLEILASVQNCADKSFDSLEHLVMHHLSVISGCICILQKWDDARRKFIDKLKALNVPLMVVLVAAPGGGIPAPEAARIKSGGCSFHVLELGKIEQGLAKLK
jgi:hypothetical protein